MKRFIRNFTILLLFFPLNIVNSQVTVSGSNGNVNGTYSTLKLAFDALNSIADQTNANITVTVNSNGYSPDSETDPCVINQPLNFSWNSFQIIPIGNVTISGNIEPGFPLIDLNSADKINIDGLNSGGNSLTISNSSTSSTAETSTIRFQRDATFNKITNCSILGSATMEASINGGTVYFSSGAILRGNDSNTISYCNIGPAGQNLPSKGIYSNGTNSSQYLYNSGNKITECNIYDFFNGAGESSGIYITRGSREFYLTNNKLYQSLPRSQTIGSIHSAIKLTGYFNSKCFINGNTIGNSSSDGTGIYDFSGVSSASKFYPVYISVRTTDTVNIQGNFIKNIKCSGAVSGTDTTSPFTAIMFVSGRSFIGNLSGNIIGSSDSEGSIVYESSGNSSTEIYGIFHADTSSLCNITNNKIGGLIANNIYSNGLSIYCIRANTSIRYITGSKIDNNNIGYSEASIRNLSVSNFSRIIGIHSFRGPVSISINNISNLISSAPNKSLGAASSVIGICIENISSYVSNIINRNSISFLENTNLTEAVSVTGIAYNGQLSGSNYVASNIIRTFEIYSNNVQSELNGIYVEDGSATYQNNFISLGNYKNGNSITKNIKINGINETNYGSNNFFCNSIYIGGSGVELGNNNTYALFSSIKDNLRKYRNNILYNARSNSAGTGSHFAIRIGGSPGNTTGLTIINNIYFTSGNGGVLGYFNVSPVYSIVDWKNPAIGPGQDSYSYFTDPQFENPEVSYRISLDTNTVANNNGFVGTQVSTDIEGDPRNSFHPDIGADEFIGTYIYKLNVKLQACPSDSIKISFVEELLCIPVSVKTLKISDQGPYSFKIYGLADIIPSSAPVFFLKVQQKSSLKLWSKHALVFSYDGTGEYDFTSSQDQDYSSNLTYNGSGWAMIGGDINQDDLIDAVDLASVNNDANSQIPGSVSGYTGTDINCDGYTDAEDQAIVDNNSLLSLVVIPPCP